MNGETMNLRTKFQLASGSLILTLVMGIMLSLYISQKKDLRARMEIEQSEDLAKLARVYEDGSRVKDELTVFKYVDTLVNAPTVAYAGVVEKAGSCWVKWGGRELEFHQATDSDVASILESNRFMRRVVSMGGMDIIELTQPVENFGYVRLGYSKKALDQQFEASVKEMVKRVSLFGFISILFGLFLSQLLSSALARPINRLMEAALEIAHGKKGVQIPVYGSDELGRLTVTFNQMSQELTKLDSLKDDFMSHVTHELRSPLTSIIATVELLAEMPLAAKDPKFRRSIDRLVYGSERLNRLVDNILDLTRMEAGKMPFDIQPANIGGVIYEMADFFEPRAMEKGLKINAMVPKNLPLVMADVERIRQVISNLVYNAIKFTNHGGIVIWAKEKDGFIQIGIQDTGVGIPQEKIGHLFQKFECLKDTKDRVNKPVPGSGLGLVIVKNSVQAQGGTIWVESEVDKGTTFIFTLPIAPASVQSAQPPMASGLSSESSMLANREPVPPKPEAGRHPVMMDEPEKRMVI
jgi:signal transduction histidine kinase